MTPKLMSALAVSAGALVLSCGIGLAIGSGSMSFANAISNAESLDREVLMLRASRVALGVIAGGGLAAVGVAFQTVLRNPLAEPYVLGVSGGAALGATICILAGLGTMAFASLSIVSLAALACGMLATMTVYALARGRGRDTGAAILLAGIVVNAIASAAITFLKTLVAPSTAQELLFWLMGFLDVQSTQTIITTAVYVLVGSAILLRDAGRLNLLALGAEGATYVGVDVRALELRTFLACSAVVGAIVSVTGLIGFVGLIVPHALRLRFGPDVRVLLPASLLGGGAILVLCDALSRVLFRFLHTAPPVGAVTALIGGPLFFDFAAPLALIYFGAGVVACALLYIWMQRSVRSRSLRTNATAVRSTTTS